MRRRLAGASNAIVELFRTHLIEFSLAFLILVFLLFLLWGRVVYTIQPGDVGVYWGRVTGTNYCLTLNSGVHLAWPWDRIIIYDGKLQEGSERIEALANNGLSIGLDITYRFQLIQDNIPVLNDFVGPDYKKQLIAPEVSALTRAAVAARQPVDIVVNRATLERAIEQGVEYQLYYNYDPVNLGDNAVAQITMQTPLPPPPPSINVFGGPTQTPVPPPRPAPRLAATPLGDRSHLTNQVTQFPTYNSQAAVRPPPQTQARYHLNCPGRQTVTHFQWVYMQALLITGLDLPPELETAIQHTNEAQQRLFEYYWINREEQAEAQRKVIEARGVAQASSIMSKALTDRYLRYLGIGATVTLAQSENAKVVVIGSGSGNGLPLILGNDIGPDNATTGSLNGASNAAKSAPLVGPTSGLPPANAMAPQQWLEQQLGMTAR